MADKPISEHMCHRNKLFHISIHLAGAMMSRLQTKFCLRSFDAIGFDMDGVVAKYNFHSFLTVSEYSHSLKYMMYLLYLQLLNSIQ